MVFGFSIAVTWVPLVSQCAEITKTASGLGISLPNFAQVRENSLFSIPFIGEPCPMNNTGILVLCSFKVWLQLYNGCNDVIANPPNPNFINVFLFIAFYNICTYKYNKNIPIRKIKKIKSLLLQP